MTWRRFAQLCLLSVLLTAAVQPAAVAQLANRIVWNADGSGNVLTSALEGSLRGLHVILVDPDTNAAVDYVSDSRGSGASDSTTLRTVEATDSQMSAGIGATTDSAATAGSTGSLNAKLRLLTSPINGSAYTIGGTAADGASETGNPVGLGGYARAGVSGTAVVSAGQRTALVSGVDRILITRPHANLEDLANSGSVDVSAGSSTSVLAAAGSSIKYYVTSVVCTNPTTSTEVYLDIRDGTGGSVIATVPCPVAGAIYNPPTPISGFTANTAVAVDPSAASTGLKVTVLAFKSRI
jgi:hypothetical protein